jgi:hypothetical protein
MPFAGRVLDEDDFARADHPRLAVARGDLHPGVEVNDVLPARRRVPVEIVIGLHLAEDNAGGGQPLRQLAGAALFDPLDVDVAEMRLALGIGVKIVDPHRRLLGGTVELRRARL